MLLLHQMFETGKIARYCHKTSDCLTKLARYLQKENSNSGTHTDHRKELSHFLGAAKFLWQVLLLVSHLFSPNCQDICWCHSHCMLPCIPLHTVYHSWISHWGWPTGTLTLWRVCGMMVWCEPQTLFATILTDRVMFTEYLLAVGPSASSSSSLTFLMEIWKDDFVYLLTVRTFVTCFTSSLISWGSDMTDSALHSHEIPPYSSNSCHITLRSCD